jgi:uncharacterized membrane protein
VGESPGEANRVTEREDDDPPAGEPGAGDSAAVPQEDAFDDELENSLQQIPAERLVAHLSHREEADALIAFQRISYSGPLPPPHVLHEYSEIDPEFAKTVVSMAENEQKHRHGKEKRGQYFALFSVLAVLAVGTFMVWRGFPDQAKWVIGATVAVLAVVFITGQLPKHLSSRLDDSDD